MREVSRQVRYLDDGVIKMREVSRQVRYLDERGI